LWKEPVLDLVYVHNLLNWKQHLKTLRAAQDEGDVRYIGLTTSHGRRHEELEGLIKSEPIEAVQLTYNVLRRDVEDRLLPLIQDKGLSLIVNRPLYSYLGRRELADTKLGRVLFEICYLPPRRHLRYSSDN